MVHHEGAVRVEKAGRWLILGRGSDIIGVERQGGRIFFIASFEGGAFEVVWNRFSQSWLCGFRGGGTGRADARQQATNQGSQTQLRGPHSTT